MSILENHTTYNRFIMQEGLQINDNSCTEYALSRKCLNLLKLEEINEATNYKVDKLCLLQKKIENGSISFLYKIQDYIDRGFDAFAIVETIKYRGGGAVDEDYV